MTNADIRSPREPCGISHELTCAPRTRAKALSPAPENAALPAGQASERRRRERRHFEGAVTPRDQHLPRRRTWGHRGKSRKQRPRETRPGGARPGASSPWSSEGAFPASSGLAGVLRQERGDPSGTGLSARSGALRRRPGPRASTPRGCVNPTQFAGDGGAEVSRNPPWGAHPRGDLGAGLSDSHHSETLGRFSGWAEVWDKQNPVWLFKENGGKTHTTEPSVSDRQCAARPRTPSRRRALSSRQAAGSARRGRRRVLPKSPGPSYCLYSVTLPATHAWGRWPPRGAGCRSARCPRGLSSLPQASAPVLSKADRHSVVCTFCVWSPVPRQGTPGQLPPLAAMNTDARTSEARLSIARGVCPEAQRLGPAETLSSPQAPRRCVPRRPCQAHSHRQPTHAPTKVALWVYVIIQTV